MNLWSKEYVQMRWQIVYPEDTISETLGLIRQYYITRFGVCAYVL